MILYRVTDVDGYGVYYSGFGKKEGRLIERIGDSLGCNLWYESNATPLPENDGITDFDENFIFGFADKVQFKSWFHQPGVLSNLHKHGCKVKKFKADPKFVRVGNKQVCFDDRFAELVEEFSIPKFIISVE